ncbi:MAG: type II secretion system F family protein [Gammaproteobacteria bacterium]|nr:MAG: type II secretion system F family protein [Gammaproteobacteria bacterium]
MAVETKRKTRTAVSRPAARKPAEKLKTFVWEGTDRRGNKVSGELPAPNMAMVKAQLRKQGFTPTKVKPKGIELFSGRSKPVTPADIAVVSRQLATMVKAGVPIVQALAIISQGHEKASVRDLVAQIRADLESGAAFHEALRKHPRQFDELFCDLVQAGEASGKLEDMLARIALYKEKTESLKKKIKKALFYPVAVIIMAIIVTAVLLIKVVPTFADLFKGFGADLPAFTQLVINLSNSLQESWFYYFAGIIALIFAHREASRRSKEYRDFIDKLLLKIPIIGEIIEKAAIARFARTLSTTFAAGVPLMEALDSAAGASGNALFRDAIRRIRDDVATGTQLNVAMQMTNVFPNMVVQMAAIGEEAGSLEHMLAKVADVYEEEVDNAVDSLSSLIEPLIMAILGVLIGGLIVAMYLPIFQMGQVI